MKMSAKYTKLIVNLLFLAAGLFMLIYVLPRFIVFFLPLVIGWIVAVLANPLVRFLEKRLNIVRKHSSALVIILAIGLVVLVLYLIIARLGSELLGFIYGFPELYGNLEVELARMAENLTGFTQKLPEGLRTVFSSFVLEIDTYMGAIIERISEPTVSAAGDLARKIPGFFMSMIFMILSAYFFTADRERIMKFFRENMPQSIVETTGMAIDTLKKAIGGYFIAQFKIMGVVFGILLIGFLLLRVRYAVLLAFIFSLLDFLPFLGTAITLVPWAIFQLLAGEYGYALGLLIIYAVSQLVRQMIQPKVVGDTVGMSPVATLIYIYIGYKVWGVLGMLVAVPIGVLLTNLYKLGSFKWITENLSEFVENINKIQ